MDLNIFNTLSRYATRQEENFLTAALVYLLNLLLEKESALTNIVLQKICGEKTATWLSNPDTISITTQLTVEEGRPDIVVTIGDEKVVFIEVKHDSSLGHDQLERYFDHLEKSSFREKQLVLLTRSRHSIQETSLDRDQFHHVCWYEISGWLSEAEINDDVSKFLVNQFLNFLKEKEMSMEKITWEFMQGVPAMISLANMIGIAISEALPEEKTKRTAGWSWRGYYIGEGTDVWIGFRYSDPLKIIFENNDGNDTIFSRELDLPQNHFFSLSAGDQLESLIEFVKKSYSEYLKKKV